MAERVIFLTSSSSELLRGFFVPPQMVEDLLVIAQLPRETIDRLVTELDSAVGFLSGEELKQLVEGAVSDERLTSAVVSTIRNLRPGKLDEVLASVREWREADAQNAQRLPDGTLTAIQENLRRLIREYPAWDRFRKARRLAAVTGNKARQVELICDARPVFDRDRQRIEGFVPLTTLKVVYETQTEEIGCIEVLLSADLLDALLEKTTKVKQKVAVLRDSLNEWIPEGIVDPSE